MLLNNLAVYRLDFKVFLGLFLGFMRFIMLIITRPRGPNLGARVAAGPPSPPNTLILTM